MPKPNTDGPYLYFSYGSNLSREKLRTRGLSNGVPIEFTRTWIGHLTDWQLCFDLLGAPPVEPVMGSIRRAVGDEVYGLVYELKTRECWEKLLNSEGVTSRPEYDSYRVVEVEVECYERGRPEERVMRKVKTFTTNDRYKVWRKVESNMKPSRRYLDILITGAECEGLPREYIEQLKGIRVARRWSRSPLLWIMTMAIPMVFMMRRWNVSWLVIPVTRGGMRLYARHEKIMDSERGIREHVQLTIVRGLLFALYAVFALMTVVMCLVNKRTRATVKRVSVLLKKGAEQNKQEAKETVARQAEKIQVVKAVEKGF